MISVQDLKGMYLLGKLTDEMLEKIVGISEFRRFKQREVIFGQGQKADKFCMLKSGKVLLEAEVSERIVISLGSIKPGYSFGWSALLAGATHTTHAVCSEPSEVLLMPGDRFQDLLREDHSMGFFVMEHAARIVNDRLKRRTGQLVKVLARHPDLESV